MKKMNALWQFGVNDSGNKIIAAVFFCVLGSQVSGGIISTATDLEIYGGWFILYLFSYAAAVSMLYLTSDKNYITVLPVSSKRRVMSIVVFVLECIAVFVVVYIAIMIVIVVAVSIAARFLDNVSLTEEIFEDDYYFIKETLIQIGLGIVLWGISLISFSIKKTLARVLAVITGFTVFSIASSALLCVLTDDWIRIAVIFAMAFAVSAVALIYIYNMIRPKKPAQA